MIIGKKIGKVVGIDSPNILNFLTEFGILTMEMDDKYLKIAISKRMI
jgi:hypothetical protein